MNKQRRTKISELTAEIRILACKLERFLDAERKYLKALPADADDEIKIVKDSIWEMNGALFYLKSSAESLGNVPRVSDEDS